VRTAFIVNPVAGGGRALHAWRALEAEALRVCAPAEIVMTTGPGVAATLACDVASRATRLVAVGGDGTFSEVLNGLMAQGGIRRPDLTLSLISVGTGRDLARSLGLPPDPRPQLARVVEGSLHPFDVGRVRYHEGDTPRERYFANVASFGLSGATDRIMARHRSRRLPPTRAFQVAVLQAMAVYRNTAVRWRIDAGDWQQARVKLGVVCNGQYFGAGMRIGPSAVADDGLLEWVVVGDIGPLTLLRRLPTVYRGEHTGLPEVSCARGRTVEAEPVTPGADVPLDIDGEAIGSLPARFEILPRALGLRY
jgi:YegS/Rv2252/BmrU family lipid kinase